jgi:excisionase family DNA binding protein
MARRLGLSPATIYELINKGEIPHTRVGGSILVRREDFERFLEEARRGEK